MFSASRSYSSRTSCSSGDSSGGESSAFDAPGSIVCSLAFFERGLMLIYGMDRALDAVARGVGYFSLGTTLGHLR